MEKAELDNVLNLVRTYYAINDEAMIVLIDRDRLAAELDKARYDNRWLEFKNCVQEKMKGEKITIRDKTTYAVSTACFKMMINVATEEGIKFLIVFYVSIIANYYYVYKIRKIYSGETLENLLEGEKDQVFIDKLRSLYGKENLMMDLVEKK